MKKLQLFTSSAFFAMAMLFCSFQTSAANISGRVWDDLNTNGIQDLGEPGMSSIWVLLQDANGNQLDGKLTGANGSYSFSNVAAGTYILKIANPGGDYNFTYPNQGDDGKDSDASVLGLVNFTLTAAQNVVYDAGLTITNLGCFTPVIITITNILCNNNGTPCNPADDTFTFQLTATGGTGAWGWDLPALGILMFPYGTPRTFGPYPVSGGPVSLTIKDHDNMDCTASVTVTPPTCAPPPAVLTLTCAANETVFTDPGKETWTVVPKLPTASTTCPTGGVTITQTGGPVAGTKVVPGMYTFTFKAVDECCQEKTCTYKITVKSPCDTYIQGPTIVDLLEIVTNATHHKTYCMRVTNTSNSPMTYAAFSLPNGIVAESPADNAIYTAPSGRKYQVRNPNFSPFYSIRFKTAPGTTGISGGQSDIFKYTLQPQTNPWNIHAIVRTEPKIFNDWYLSTADCMPPLKPNGTSTDEIYATSDEPTDPAVDYRGDLENGKFAAYPNPVVGGVVSVELSKWEGQAVKLALLNSQGQLIRAFETTGSDDIFQISVEELPTGIYFLRGVSENKEVETLRLTVKN